MESYLLGIDCGNTVCKATIFSFDGQPQGTASGRVEARRPQTGFAELDPDNLWSTVCSVIRDVIKVAQIAPKAIRVVGVCGHGNGLYGLDISGAPVIAIQSLDFRAEGICDQWNETGVSEAAFAYSRQRCWPGQTNSLLAWLKAHQLAAYQQLDTVFFCKDYLNYRLTGTISTDYSDLSVTNLVDIVKRALSPELCRAFGLSDLESKIPSPARGEQVIGAVTAAASEQTGLPVGIPVVAGMIDLVANMVGCGSIVPGSATIISGSWSVNCLLSEVVMPSETLAMVSLFVDPALQLAIEASPTAMTNLEWFVNQFMKREKKKCKKNGTSVFSYCDSRLAARVPFNSDVLFLPFLHGNNLNGIIRSGFYNLSGAHTKDDLLQAVYEGIAFSHLAHVERLRSSGHDIQNARFTGGGARSPVFSQLLSNVLQVELEGVQVPETGCLGASMAAAIGIGVYSDYAEAGAAMVTPKSVYTPDGEMAEYYNNKFAEYKAFAASMVK